MKGKSQLIKENIVDGLAYFRKAEMYNKNDYPLYIYKGLCEFLLKEFTNSSLSYQRGLRLIEINKGLNQDEKAYLKLYIIENMLHSCNILEDYKKYDEYNNIYKSLEFNVNKVRKYFIYDFPLNSRIKRTRLL